VKLGELEQARIIFNRILTLNANDIEAVLSLAEINAQIVQRLDQELGKVSLRKRIIEGLVILLRRKWSIIILIFALHFILLNPYVNNTENSTQYRLTHLFEPIKPKTISTLKDLESLSQDGNAVRIKLENAQFMGIYQLQKRDANGINKIWYLRADEAEKNDLMSLVTAYIGIGYLGDYSIIVRTNYDQSVEMYNNHKIELEGLIHTPPPSDLMDTVNEYWIKNVTGSAAYVSEHWIANFYIDSIVEPPEHHVVLIGIDYWLFLLGLLYILLLLELRRTWKFIRYN
jgi:hypothetical protein